MLDADLLVHPDPVNTQREKPKIEEYPQEITRAEAGRDDVLTALGSRKNRNDI
jgi:hypothetical protein